MRLRTMAFGALCAIAAILFIVPPPPALAYYGVLLSTDAGLMATGSWMTPGPTSLQWWVTPNQDNSWHYRYYLTHPSGATSHFILEVSTTFTREDIFNAHGDFGGLELSTFEAGGSNPSMPGPVFGIKFDETWGNETTIEFDSSRAPMWGDFYAKDGAALYGDAERGPVFNTAYNAGFLAADPTAAPTDGALAAHLLVPDTHETPPVPEPSTLLLLGSGLVGLAAAARRRRA